MRKKISIPLILLALFSLDAFSKELSDMTQSKEKVSKDWSINFKNTLTTNMHQFDSVNHYAVNESRMDINFKSGDSTYGIYAILAKELQGEREQSLSDINIKFIRKFTDLTDNITLTHYPILKLPTSEDSNDRANLNAQLTYILYTTIDGKAVGNENFSFTILPYITKGFHEYKTTTTGSSNTEWTLSFNPSAEYAMTDAFSIGIEAGYTRGFTYEGNSKDAYSFGTYLSLDLFEDSNATLGYEIGGAPLASNGRDTRINLLDNKEGNIYLELSTKF